MRALRLLLVASLILASGAAAARSPQIFVAIHASNGISRMTTSNLRQIFQGSRTHWSNRRRVRIVVPLDDSPEMEVLATEILRVGSAERVASFYLQRVFQQRASDVPPQLSRTAAIAYITREPGAIALFVEKAPPGSDSVIVLTVEN